MLEKIKSIFSQLYNSAGLTIVTAGMLLVLPALLFLPKLGSLMPPGTVFEQLDYLGAASGAAFYGDMLNAPLRATYFAVGTLSDNVFYLRLAAAVVATLSCLCLFLALRRWHTLRITVLASFMFITSSWVLHAGRVASIEVLYLLVIPAMFLVGCWATSKADDKKLPLAVMLLAIILYVPGTWLLLLVGMGIYWSHVRRIWKKVSLNLKLGGISLMGVLLSPLIISFAYKPSGIIDWLGFSDYKSWNLDTVVSNLLAIPDAIFYRGLDEPTAWLVGTPVLDYFAIVMFVIGCFAYRTGGYPIRERMVFATLIVCIILVAAGGIARIGLLIPLIYIFIANGLAYMLQSWFTVFPRNPVARSIGLSIVFVAVLVSSSYQLQRYFVAWPNSTVIEQLRQ